MATPGPEGPPDRLFDQVMVLHKLLLDVQKSNNDQLDAIKTTMREGFEAVDGRIQAIDARCATLETNLNGHFQAASDGFTQLRTDTIGAFNKTESQFGSVGAHFQTIAGHLERVENRLAQVETTSTNMQMVLAGPHRPPPAQPSGVSIDLNPLVAEAFGKFAGVAMVGVSIEAERRTRLAQLVSYAASLRGTYRRYGSRHADILNEIPDHEFIKAAEDQASYTEIHVKLRDIEQRLKNLMD